jgi:hypothetical protein
MMAWLLLAVGLPTLAVFIAIRRSLGPGSSSAVLAGGVAAGLGTGMSAAVLMIWRFLAPQDWFALFPWVDVSVWSLVAAWALRTRSGIHSNYRRRPSHGVLVAALVAMTAVSLVYFVLHQVRMPHGEWDAWAIWNLKARFLVRGGAYWQDVYSTAIPHPGYPHLIPSAVARLWMWLGSEAPLAGAVVAAVFTYATPAVVMGSLAFLRDWTAALWGGLLVVAGTPLTYYGAWQVADVPLGFFMLTSVALIAIDMVSEERWWFAVVAGLAVGLSGLVKDEGLPFMIAMTLGYVGYQVLGRRRYSFRDRSARAAGFMSAALPLWCLLVVGRSLAPAQALDAAFTDPASLSKVADLGRHSLIIKAFITEAWGWAGVSLVGVVPVFVSAFLLAGLHRARRTLCAARAAIVALGMMTAAYYAAFLVTPYDLSWHVLSLNRILVHVWPTFVWAFCLVVSFDPDRSGMPRRPARVPRPPLSHHA